MFNNIKLLTFDLDDTLWPCLPTIINAEEKLYAWLQRHVSRLTTEYDIQGFRDHRVLWAKQHPESAHNLTKVRLKALEQLMLDFSVDTKLAEQANDVFRQARNQVSPFDDVIESLARLRQGYTLVAVTNGNVEIQNTVLSKSFDFHFTAEQVGAAKPDPALFFAAEKASGIKLSQSLHLGDDPRLDVQAARDTGMKTVWLNSMNRDWPNDIVPADLDVSSLSEFVAAVFQK